MIHFQILISVISLFGWSGIFQKYIQKDFSLSFYYACTLTILTLYIAGLTDTLELTTIFLRSIGLFCAALTFKTLLKKETLNSPSFIFITLSVVYLYLICVTDNYRNYSGIDDYSHWGRMMRLLTEKKSLIQQTDPISIKDNPPYATLFQYFFTNFSGFKNSLALFTQALLTNTIFAILLIPIDNKKTKTARGLFFFSVAVIVGLIWIFGKGYHSLQADLLLGVTFGVSLVIYNYYKKTNCINAILMAAPAVISLAFIKQIGILFSVFAILYIMTDVLLYQEKKEKLKKIILLAIIVCGAFILRQTWNLYLNAQNIPISKLPNIDINQIISAFLPATSSQFQQEVIRNYIDYLFFSHHTSTYWFLVSLIMAFININLRKQLKLESNHFLYAISFVFFIAYLIVLLVLYIFSFSPWEAVRAASATRYIKTMSLSMVIFFYGELMVLLQHHEIINKNKIKLIFLYVLLIVPNLGRAVNDNIATITGKVTETEAANIEKMAFAVNSKTGENEKIYFIWSDISNDNAVIFNYSVYPRESNISCSSIKPIDVSRTDQDPWSCHMTVHEFRSKIENFDYVYIAYASHDFKNNFLKNILVEENPQGLFEIIGKSNNALTLRQIK